MHLIFKIIRQKKIPLDIPLDEMRKYPVHYHELIQVDEKVYSYLFKPADNCDVDEYKEYLCRYFKQLFKAYSVEVGQLQKQIVVTSQKK